MERPASASASPQTDEVLAEVLEDWEAPFADREADFGA
jgi:hypothetical protein